MTRLSRVMWGEGKGEEKGTRCGSQEAKGTERKAGNQNVWIIQGRTSGGKGSPAPGLEKCREGSGVCGPCPVTGRA